MAKQHTTPEENPTEKLSEAYDRLELFYEEHKQKVLAGLGIVVALVAGLVIYNKLIKGPKVKESLIQIAQAQVYFEQDSFKLALNGDGNYLGFKSLADKFSGTPAGNTAKYYAGICELQTGNFKGAIAYLEDFSTADPLIQAMAHGCTGDAYMELNQADKGISFYEKAVNASGDDVSGILFLDRLAKAQEVNKKYEDAIASYERMKTDFPKTPEAGTADKNITRLQVMLGQ